VIINSVTICNKHAVVPWQTVQHARSVQKIQQEKHVPCVASFMCSIKNANIYAWKFFNCESFDFRLTKCLRDIQFVRLVMLHRIVKSSISREFTGKRGLQKASGNPDNAGNL